MIVLPRDLEKEIITFLGQLPDLHDNASYRAFIIMAGLEPELARQIRYDVSCADFVPLLISTLQKYGTLKDIEDVLVEAKDRVGWHEKEWCDLLLQKLSTLSRQLKHKKVDKNIYKRQTKDEIWQNFEKCFQNALSLDRDLILKIGMMSLDEDESIVRLRFWVNDEEVPIDAALCRLDTTPIQPLIKAANRGYYMKPQHRGDIKKAGQELYEWLNTNKVLAQAIKCYPGVKPLVLAISTERNLVQLPWEALFDKNAGENNEGEFLIERTGPDIVPVRWVGSPELRIYQPPEPLNPPLSVLFMAASPEDGKQVELDFEKEEGAILDHTSSEEVFLVVEESGDLDELRRLVDRYGEDDFDIFHLTGHGKISDGIPRFLTETDMGESRWVTADEIASALKRKPRIVFLSGCHTGQYPEEDSVPSLAEQLLGSGFNGVLGWGYEVGDHIASMASAILYTELANGYPLPKALLETYKQLFRNHVEDWHLLRLYVRHAIPGALVRPGNRRTGFRHHRPHPAAERFLDSQGKVKVPARESFVGRRRLLQRCLKSLRLSKEKFGVVLFGMGGSGKSSIASRLCDRLAEYQPCIMEGVISANRLIQKMLDDTRLKRLLSDDLDELGKQNWSLDCKLLTIFDALEKSQTPVLLVLDDFEANYDDNLRLCKEAGTVLDDLLKAICESRYRQTRIIITSRYRLEGSVEYCAHEGKFFQEQVHGFTPVEQKKMLARLQHGLKTDTDQTKGETPVSKAVEMGILTVAEGNPRLMQWLYEIERNKALDHKTIIEKMKAVEDTFREELLAKELLEAQDTGLQEMLRHILIFEIPVPEEAVFDICEDSPDLATHISRAVAVCLLELTQRTSHDLRYYVRRIFAPLLPAFSSDELSRLYTIAAEALYGIWWRNQDVRSPQEALEIWRLAMKCDLKAEIVGDIATEDDFCSKLMDWGYYQETIQLLEKVQNDIVDDPERAQECFRYLGDAYQHIGKIEESRHCYRAALDIAQKMGDREGVNALCNRLGIAYLNLGMTHPAIKFFKKTEEFYEVDTIAPLIDLHFKSSADTSNEDIIHQKAEALKKHRVHRTLKKVSILVNLGICQARLDKLDEAFEQFEQASGLLTSTASMDDIDTYLKEQIEKEQANVLLEIGRGLINKAEYEEALQIFTAAKGLADPIRAKQSQHEACWGMAVALLLQSGGNEYHILYLALEKAKLALEQYPRFSNTHNIQNLIGIITFRIEKTLKKKEIEIHLPPSKEAFSAALEQVEKLLKYSTKNFAVWHVKWLALCGLALCSEAGKKLTDEAVWTYRKLLTLNTDEGSIRHTLNLFTILDKEQKLADVRQGIVKEEAKAQIAIAKRLFFPG